jgi:aspartyl-tRNA(Asn)/glutamyl-tRNA(Gln) amidotransferase subunit A
MDGVRDTFQTLWYATPAKLVRSLPDSQLGDIDPGLLAIAALGDRLSPPEYLAALDAQVALGQRMNYLHHLPGSIRL